MWTLIWFCMMIVCIVMLYLSAMKGRFNQMVVETIIFAISVSAFYWSAII